MHNLVWLTSYPKSGNTWLRLFLSVYLSESDTVSINSISIGINAATRFLLDEALGHRSSLLTHTEILQHRTDWYQHLSQNTDEMLFFKVHDILLTHNDNRLMFPEDSTKAVIYLVRNPLDIAVSFANHNGSSIEVAVYNMCENKTMTLAGQKNVVRQQTPQLLATWGQHVKSWISSPLPILVIRYEDLVQNPIKHFTKIIEFIFANTEHDINPDQIELAVHETQFEKLQKQEEQAGFREKNIYSKKFFRKGIVGDWRNILKHEQIDKIIISNYEMMYKFGYIDARGNPQ